MESVITRRNALLALASLVLMAAWVCIYQFGVHFRFMVDDTMTDFRTFWVVGHALADGLRGSVFDPAKLGEVQDALFGASSVRAVFFYPPSLFPICEALARLGYDWSFATWEFAQLALFLFAVRAITKQTNLSLAFVALPSCLFSIAIGQNALLTAALFGFGGVLMSGGRKFTAGLVLGLLLYKPQFACMLPVAMLAGRNGASSPEPLCRWSPKSC
jgi:hypothetical protein